MWTGEDVSDTFGVGVQSFVEKDDLTSTVRACEHLAPDGVFDATLCLPVGMQGLVHPADFLLHLVEDLPRGLRELVHVKWEVVIRGDKGRGRSEIAQDHTACAPLGF